MISVLALVLAIPFIDASMSYVLGLGIMVCSFGIGFCFDALALSLENLQFWTLSFGISDAYDGNSPSSRWWCNGVALYSDTSGCVEVTWLWRHSQPVVERHPYTSVCAVIQYDVATGEAVLDVDDGTSSLRPLRHDSQHQGESSSK